MDTVCSHLVNNAFADGATDVFLIENELPRMRREGDVVIFQSSPVSQEMLAGFWRECGVDPAISREADVSWQPPSGGRVRVNLYRTLGRLAAVLRPIRSDIPSLVSLGMPAELLGSWMQRRYGLVLVTGPTGSGKSTTVAACLDWINHHQCRHIVTLEDPIEYLFSSDLSHFSQREIRQDTENFSTALRSALRQSPDVLFLGEIRDAETAITALQAAETGHLVISTLHSSSVSETIERFSHLIGGAASGAVHLLSSQLIGVISQQLLPRLGGGLIAALEYFQNEAATRRWIVEGRLPELRDHLNKTASPTHCSLLECLVSFTRQGFIDPDVARSACARPQDFDRVMRGITG